MNKNRKAHRQLRKFAKALDQDVEKAMAMASKKCGQQLLKFTKQTFKDQKDPHGTPWKPKKRPDGRKILHGKTGELRRLWKVEEASREKWSVAPGAPHFGFHQKPAVNQVRRAMVPFRGLPKKYDEAFSAIYVAELAKVVG